MQTTVTTLPSEAHAMLVYVLHRTGATVVNPVTDGGAFGEAALRPEHWMAVAASARRRRGATGAAQHAGRPRPATRDDTRRGRRHQHVGDVAATLVDAAVAVCAALGLEWAVLAFDDADRLTAITTRSRPSAAATARLAQLLAAPCAA